MVALTLIDIQDILQFSFVIIKDLLNWGGNYTTLPREILMKIETSHMNMINDKVQLGNTQR